MVRPGVGLSDAEINRGLAARSVDRLEAALERATLESSALARWLLGALVAMHLAALLFIALFAGRLADETVRQGLAAFATGALLAFLAALVSGVATFFIARMIRAATGEWMEVVANGTDSGAAVAAARRLRRFANLWRAVAILAGLISLLLLLAGAATIARDVIIPAPRAENSAPPPEAPTNQAAPDNAVAGDDAVTEVEPARSILPSAAPVAVQPAPEAVRPVPVPASAPPKPAPKTEPAKPAAPKPEPKPASKPAPAKPAPAKPVPAKPTAPPPAATPPPQPAPALVPQLPVIVPQTDPGSSGGGR